MTSTNGQGHTKGPWVLQDGYVVAGAWPLGVTICEPTMAHSGNRLTPDEALANGRLIAAAPDLLEALLFYADPRRYQGPNQKPIENDRFAKEGEVYIRDVTRDGGEIARAALSRVSGEGR